MPSLTKDVPNDSDVARRIRGEVMRRVRLWEKNASSKFERWEDAENKANAFIQDTEVDRARKTARAGGMPQYTTIQIPYTYAVLMSAHTYLTSVFLARDPVFGYRGLHGEGEQQVQAVEALIAYQVSKGAMMPYLYTWLHDALKYGQGVVCNWWDEQIHAVSEIQEFQEFDELTGLPTGMPEKKQKTELHRVYSGNTLENVQPQDFIWDTRFTMREFQKGEFAGRKRMIPWNQVIQREKLKYYTNVKNLDKGTGQTFDTFNALSSSLERPDNWDGEYLGDYDSKSSGHPASIEVYELAVNIIPSEWMLSKSDYPEKWVFTVTTDFSVLIGIQPLASMHCMYPYSVIPFEPEGYGLTVRGMPEILDPVQNTIDWLVNTHFYNVRASLNDRWVVDPSRVVMKDVLDPLPGKIIRLRPEAYGTDPQLSIRQFPSSNVTQGHIMQDLPAMFGLGERAIGVNDQIMGMLNTGGGRKTATEVRTSTSFGINRLKTVAEFASCTGMDPLSRMLVQNSQQYYDLEMKLRIVGDLAMEAGQEFIMVDPESIAGFYEMVPVDGSLPVDKQQLATIWQQMMTQAYQVPQIAMSYDWSRIFSWVAKLAGLRNIDQFKVQVLPDQQLMMMQQAGQSIPLNGAGAGGGSIAPKQPSGSAPGAQMMHALGA
jgi:hypothetical protein